MPSLRQRGAEVVAKSRASFKTQLVIIIFSRTAINTAHRIIYPFLPALARGLGISLGVAGTLITARLVAGLAAPFLGPVADRYPRRSVMEIALLILVAAGVLLAGFGTLVTATVAFGLYGLAKVVHDPSVYAFVGDTVPYHRRGRVVGIIELAWSAAWLIGVPLAGFLIEGFGWRAPWSVLAVLGLVGLGVTRFGLPLSRSATPQTSDARLLPSLVRVWRSLLARRHVVLLLCISLLISMALEIPFIVYGAWLETAFGLSLGALGLASVVVGLAEATAELGTTAFTDRLGKKRSVLLGLLGLAASLVALPSLAQLGLAGALGGVVLVMLTFEFGIVSLMPVATETAPDARATMISLNITAFSLGRMVGAVAGGWLWEWWDAGIALNAFVGAGVALLAAGLVGFGMVEIDD